MFRKPLPNKNHAPKNTSSMQYNNWGVLLELVNGHQAGGLCGRCFILFLLSRINTIE